MLSALALCASPACASVRRCGLDLLYHDGSAHGLAKRLRIRPSARVRVLAATIALAPRSSAARQRGPSRRHAGHAAGSRPRSWAAAWMATM